MVQVVTSPARLLAAILTMAKDRIVRLATHSSYPCRRSQQHFRKLILTEAARLFGCRHILHLHDYDYAGDLPTLAAPTTLIRRMFQHADCVVALGQRDRTTLSTLLGVEERRTVVAHNCVPDPGRTQYSGRSDTH